MKISIVIGSIIYASIILSGYSFATEIEKRLTGSELFEKHCAPCHGADAIGHDPKQPSGGFDADMNRLAPALNGTGHAWHHSPELLYEYIVKGSIDKTSPMPSFGSILKDNDIKAIIAYINSLWPDTIMEGYRKRFTNEEQ